MLRLRKKKKRKQISKLKQKVMVNVVYQHIRLDNNSIFYIGIGSVKRPYDKRMRSKFWNSIVNKVGYKVEIIYENLTWKEACNLEKSLIKKYLSFKISGNKK